MSVMLLGAKFGQMKVVDMLWGKVAIDRPSSKVCIILFYHVLAVVRTDYAMRQCCKHTYIFIFYHHALWIHLHNFSYFGSFILKIFKIFQTGLTPVHVAALYGQIEVLQEILLRSPASGSFISSVSLISLGLPNGEL